MGNLENVKKALEVNKRVYEAVRENLRPGMSEQDVYDLTKKVVDEACGDVPHEFIGDFVGGANTEGIGGGPFDHVMKAGELFILDLSVRYDDAWSDTCRTFFLGEPTDEQDRAYESVLEAQRLGESLVRAGVVASDIKEQVEALLVSKGFGGCMPHHVGHAIGDEPYAKPAFEEGCDMTVQDGEIFTLEPGIYKDGWGMRVENNYVAGTGDPECIFDYPRNIEYFILKNR
ncbi:MAG: aminopeptidase P family protein [Lachnospiraceae bacterium]|nr:aminopeptidase P family protein [Lachnospiraceae bacterium]